MESKGSGSGAQDQLQSPTLQNQAIQHRAADPRVLARARRDSAIGQNAQAEKVVVRFGDRVLKGTAGVDGLASVEAFMWGPHGAARSIEVRVLDDGRIETVPLEAVKAVFLVHSFEGDAHRQDLHFHSDMAISKGVWIRVCFADDELMEGIVLNTGAFILDPGFCLMPTDPTSNNRLVYVPKGRLKNVEVLGLRNPPSGQETF